jgi:rhodanese-related sulfurtransferase
MALTLTTLADLGTLGFDDIIDVRAPAEFAEDHLPGAISLPVLDDEERARVGTIYKQVSPFTARKLGAALVAKNAARHLEGPLADRPGGLAALGLLLARRATVGLIRDDPGADRLAGRDAGGRLSDLAAAGRQGGL